MKNRRLVERTPETHTEVWHSYDPETKTTVIEEIQDQQPYRESVVHLRDTDTKAAAIAGKSHLNPYEREGMQKGLMHVARFSNIDLMKMARSGIDLWKIDKCDWTKRQVYKLLNHSSQREKWRTGNAKV